MRSLSRYGTSTLGTALLVGMLLAWPVQAQNWIWSTVNGKPYGPGLTLTGALELAGSGAAADVFLVRDDANILAQRNGTAAQSSRLYNTFTSSTNYERFEVVWATNIIDLQTANAGAGVARVLGFGTGGTRAWRVETSGDFTAQSDNTNDIGANAATRPNDYFGAGRFSANNRATVTVDAATTFAVASSYTVLACTGVETINTITGGLTGTIVWLENTDTECTIADDDDPTAANAVDLTGAATNDVGAVAKVIGLIYNGTSWLQIFESDN